MAQDNVVKQPYMMPGVQNAAGMETGVSPESEWGAIAGESAPFAPPMTEINVSASGENRSAKFKAPNVSQDQGAGANQY